MANEEARELLRKRFNSGKQLIDITLKEDQAVAYAEDFHSSKMSGLAQRAAEKIYRRIHDEPLDPNSVLVWQRIFLDSVAAIIEQEGR